MGPGENAGVVDVGGGLGVAFKVESHNHPSAVEPFQGAATGVGGILRDVFAVGARPIAVLDSLRFGEPADSERSRYLLDRAVAGIGHYGNSIGVPTVGGEIYFESSYEQNCLVNAMCLGLAPHERLIRSAAAGPGQRARAAGRADRPRRDRRRLGAGQRRARRGRRGQAPVGPDRRSVRREEAARVLPGAARPRAAGLAAGPRRGRADLVRVGDGQQGRRRPRHRRLRGAAARGRDGAVRDHGLRVPGADAVRGRARARGRGAWRSASAGRRWPRAIGRSTTAAACGCCDGGTVAADLPVEILVDDCPLYDLEPGAAGAPASVPGAGRRCSRGAESPAETLLALLGSPNIASRRPVFEQYDPVVQSRTVRRPEEADAAVLALPDGEAIAVSIDGNGRRVACDPRAGAAEAVYECAANLACVGATPLGLTNCLNFGNPEKPHVAWQLVEAVEGIAEACEALGVPVVGGNVSLYNEAPAGPIFPTPVIGMVGRLPDAARAGPARLRAPRATRSRWWAVRAVAGRLGAGQAAGGGDRRAAAADG